MKYIFFLIFITPCFALAQDAPGYDYNKNISVKTNSDPAYPGGDDALYELVYNKLEYSSVALEEKAHGEIMINFNVNPDSSLSDFSFVKKVGYGLEENLIEILKELKFAPGMKNGTPVTKNLLMSFPIEVD